MDSFLAWSMNKWVFKWILMWSYLVKLQVIIWNYRRNLLIVVLYFSRCGSFCMKLTQMTIVKKVAGLTRTHHTLLALVRFMVGFKSKNQWATSGVIFIWGGKTHQKSPVQVINQPGKPEESLVTALCCSQPPPANIMLQIFSYIVQLDYLQTLNTFLCL